MILKKSKRNVEKLKSNNKYKLKPMKASVVSSMICLVNNNLNNKA